jgi:3-dehydroquinate synthase
LDELLNFDFKTESISNALIEKSIAIKTSIVAQDLTEKGLRKTLNFGHTIGHALESYFMQSDKARLLHGEAVALGMIAELYLSVLKNNFRKESFEYLSRQIQQIYADIKLPMLDIDELLAFMYNDKKNKDAQISFCLLQEIGKANFDNACTEVEIRQAINKLYEVIQ